MSTSRNGFTPAFTPSGNSRFREHYARVPVRIVRWVSLALSASKDSALFWGDKTRLSTRDVWRASRLILKRIYFRNRGTGGNRPDLASTVPKLARPTSRR